MISLPHTQRQIPLIQFVESDDLFLRDHVDVHWFNVIKELDYHDYQTTAAHYYEQLFTFNQQQRDRRASRRENPPAPNPETQTQATQRTLLERATLDDQAPALYEPPQSTDPMIHVAPREVLPGVTPTRLVGRPPKCFFAMLYSFLGTSLAGQRAEPEFVHQRLCENPAFARTCGFTIPRPGKTERQSDTPSLRKLQQFDQIMTEAGLWEELALDRVAANLKQGKIKTEATLVHDTTHYHAYSAMKVVELPKANETPSTPAAKTTATVKLDGQPVVVAHVKVARVPVKQSGRLATAEVPPADSESVATTEANTTAATNATTKTPTKTESGKPNSKQAKNSKSATKAPKKKRKSHPRTTKDCRCQDRDHCDHEWINADDGAGTVVKSAGRMHWAHKASTLGFPGQEVLLDAVAMSDAASHDSRSLHPHLNRLLERHPDLKDVVTRVLDDKAADDSKLKAAIQDDLKIAVLAPINPRRRAPIQTDMPRGIDHLTPRGVPVCHAGYPFELAGVRHNTEHFIFQAPKTEQGPPVCQGCDLREGCYRGQSGGRQVTIAQSRLPWLDPNFPQLSKRFAKAMSQRTSIERLHKLMKFDFGDDRLTKRGNAAFQASLDKTLFAMHVLLAHDD